MRLQVLVLALSCTALGGCPMLPVDPSPSDTAGVVTPTTVERPIPPGNAPDAAFEERLRGRAQAYARDRNLADALVHWELLSLLRPNNPEYTDAVAETRASIARETAHFMQFAEQARKQGNLDQAELWFLRVLHVDREHTAAAQALRDIDADRAKRAYSNRPPRLRM
jgi:tetratricopeptide (TPR) repeat protein